MFDQITKFSKSYMIIFFYALLMCITGVIGNQFKIIGFNKGLLIGLVNDKFYFKEEHTRWNTG